MLKRSYRSKSLTLQGRGYTSPFYDILVLWSNQGWDDLAADLTQRCRRLTLRLKLAPPSTVGNRPALVRLSAHPDLQRSSGSLHTAPAR
jgi:hypothetical protein